MSALILTLAEHRNHKHQLLGNQCHQYRHNLTPNTESWEEEIGTESFLPRTSKEFAFYWSNQLPRAVGVLACSFRCILSTRVTNNSRCVWQESNWCCVQGEVWCIDGQGLEQIDNTTFFPFPWKILCETCHLKKKHFFKLYTTEMEKNSNNNVSLVSPLSKKNYVYFVWKNYQWEKPNLI